MSVVRYERPPSLVGPATIRLLVLSWFVVALVLAQVAWTRRDLPPDYPITNGVDPNQAPWWELTVLPEVGPALARRIVHHREAILAKNIEAEPMVVFQSAEDLDVVVGIGPKTVARLTAYLRFEQGRMLPGAPSLTDHQRQPQKKQD